MKRIYLLLILIAQVSVAQNRISIGPYYTLGVSTIEPMSNTMGMGSSMMANSNLNANISFKMSVGAGLRSEFIFSEHFGVFLQTGFQQRGGLFNHYSDTYKPRYRLNYWDVNFGLMYQTKSTARGFQSFVALGLTQHTLIEASRVYDMGSDNISNSFRAVDAGGYLSVGENIPLFGKDYVQAQLFVNQGFSQMFMSYMYTNGFSGRNLLIGIQLSYQIVKPAKNSQP